MIGARATFVRLASDEASSAHTVQSCVRFCVSRFRATKTVSRREANFMKMTRFQILPHKNLIISATIALGILLVGVFSAWKDTLRQQAPGHARQEGPTVLATGTGKSSNAKLVYTPNFNPTASTSDVDNLKKEFFAKYLAEGSQNIKETTFRDLIKKVDTKAFAPRQEIINFNISSDNSNEGVRAYVNAFGVVIKRYLVNSIGRTEDAIIENAITKKDAGTKSDLQLLASIYKNFADDLVALRVPSALAKAHLLIVNGYEGMGAGLLGVGSIRSDPMRGAAGYEAYMKYRLDVTNGYAMIVSYVINQHLTFTPDEPGYPFYWNTVVGQTAR